MTLSDSDSVAASKLGAGLGRPYLLAERSELFGIKT